VGPEHETGAPAGEEEPPTGDLTHDTGLIAESIQKITERNLVSPRDASLVAGRMGIKVLPEANADAVALYGVTSRQGRSIVRRVSTVLQQVHDDSLPASAVSTGSLHPEPYALVAAELALSPYPGRSDGSRALHVLR
jgi:hypothetical protein